MTSIFGEQGSGIRDQGSTATAKRLVDGVVREKEALEGGAVSVDEEEFECGADKARYDTRWREGHVEEKDVDQDGAEDDQANGNEAADNEQEATDNVEHTDEEEPFMGEEKAREHAGIAGGQLHRHEWVEGVEAEDEEDETEENTCYENGDLHLFLAPVRRMTIGAAPAITICTILATVCPIR